MSDAANLFSLMYVHLVIQEFSTSSYFYVSETDPFCFSAANGKPPRTNWPDNFVQRGGGYSNVTVH